MTQHVARPDAEPVLHRRAEMESDGQGVRSRVVGTDPGAAWSEPVVSEWELRGAGWEDCHPYSEVNVLLEGRLHVESGGVEVVLEPGDSVTVAPGATGRYWAPGLARMLSVYGPNPDGLPTRHQRGWVLDPTD
jgi:mannose-6-phosphate isomerase-like protein (cupin superfamily)